jgi:hypothetical protein
LETRSRFGNLLRAKDTDETNVQRTRERVDRAFETAEAALNGKAAGRNGGPPTRRIEAIGDNDLPPLGRRGAAAALERLEETEERAHARLLAAMQRGNPVQIEALQDFWLKCSETLRKLDLAVEMARRDAEEQVPKKLAEQISLHVGRLQRRSNVAPKENQIELTRAGFVRNPCRVFGNSAMSKSADFDASALPC